MPRGDDRPSVPVPVDAGRLDVEIRLHGVVTDDNLLPLAHELSEGLSLRPERLILDLHDCRGLSGDAIRLVLDADAQARRTASRVVVRAPQAEVTHALAAAGVLGLLLVEQPKPSSEQVLRVGDDGDNGDLDSATATPFKRLEHGHGLGRTA